MRPLAVSIVVMDARWELAIETAALEHALIGQFVQL